MFERSTCGYLNSGSITSISLVNVPAVAPVTVRGWLLGSATNGMRFAALKAAPMRVKSTPVLPNWLEIQTYGGRPENTPTPPRSCCAPSPFKSQLKPARGDHSFEDGVMSVR